MSSINFATREISCKVVFYGPGLSGKTTNLQVIHKKMPQDKRTDMVSLATEGDRTLFFDFLPLNLGNIKGFKTRFQLYTVPGQVYYNSTRKLVLRGADGIVFVADSQRSRQAENLESLENLRQNLSDYGMSLDEMPFVLQYNKRDMNDVLTIDEMNAALNPRGVPAYPATAHNGKGVVTTLKSIAMLVIEKFNVKQTALKKAADANVGNNKVQEFSVNTPSQAPQQAEPAVNARPAARPAAPAASTPFKMPSFSSSKPVAKPATPGGGLFQKPVSNLFGRPHAESPLHKMPSFGRDAAQAAQEPADDEIELRPYIPKDQRKG